MRKFLQFLNHHPILSAVLVCLKDILALLAIFLILWVFMVLGE